MQAQDIINNALKLIGALAAGETPSTEESADALFTLQRLMDAWNAQQLAIFQIVNRSFSAQAGISSYTIGQAGTWSTPRPEKIIAGNAVVGGISHSIRIATAEEFAKIDERTAQGNRTLELWNDGGYPLSNISIWPTPYGVNVPVIELFMWQQLAQFVALTDSFDFPPGYAEAIEFNLALRLAPQFGRSASTEVVAIAQESKARLERQDLSAQMAVDQTAIPPSPVAAPTQ